ncbi:hypothetical protein LQG66_17560 [Bradyrhizobium ontarionense]|uniref:Transposase DDE domain-containing protein n=1 Tax=Bradyrhizobium ontarionense TaxID=2898149 RepID=A0ABY3RMA2_9BRAD|nr:hypothetical protein [Bradyrhizobium sp. A19]UFZ07992.1 hypothetical protein LQG66_17560 [Bradyrhizobium sp. A19]
MPELKHAAVFEDEADPAIAIGLNDVALPQRVPIIERNRDAIADDHRVTFGVDHASDDLRGLLRRIRCGLSSGFLEASDGDEAIVAPRYVGRRPGGRMVWRQMSAGDVGSANRNRRMLVRARMSGLKHGARIRQRARSNGC